MSLSLRQKRSPRWFAVMPLLLFSCGAPSTLEGKRAVRAASEPGPAGRRELCLGDEVNHGINLATSVKALEDTYGPGSYWVPSDQLMRASRPRIAEAMSHCRDSRRSFDEIMSDGCQFEGHVRGAEKILGALCLERPPCWWRKSMIFVNDGGDSVVRVALRPEDGAVLEIGIGGPFRCGPDEDGWLRFESPTGDQ